MNEDDYIDKWIDTSITLSEWRSNENIDHWDIIDQLGLTESEIEEIESHQLQLFKEQVEIKVNNTFYRLYDSVLPFEKRINLFREQLRILDQFERSTEFNPLLVRLLSSFITLRKEDYTNVILQRLMVIEGRYTYFRKDFSIHSRNPRLIAEIFFLYKLKIFDYLNSIDNIPAVTPIPQQTAPGNDNKRYTAKHYALAYLISCNANGKNVPIGQKKELEQIGNNIMSTGKGNRFYKVINEIVNKDLNVESNLIEIGGNELA